MSFDEEPQRNAHDECRYEINALREKLAITKAAAERSHVLLAKIVEWTPEEERAEHPVICEIAAYLETAPK